MEQELITALFDKWVGKPILVIGGGPSVLKDLPLPFEPACVISANGHGAHQSHYKVDIYTNLDRQHCFTNEPMESIIRPLAERSGAVVVNKHSWADYRLGDFTFTGNTGMSAIVLAAALGGHPVIPVGIDFFNGGHVYFHENEKAHPRKPLSVSRIMQKRLKGLQAATIGANIRPISGPLTFAFPQLGVPLTERRDTAYRAHMLKQKTRHVLVHREFSWGSHDRAKVGAILALTPKEAENPRVAGFVA